MSSIPRLVLWLCRKFTRQDLQQLVHELQEILAGRQPEPQPRDDFRQQHPHYRDFYVDPLAPFTQAPAVAVAAPTLDWQQLCAQYLRDHGRPLSPVRRRRDARPVPPSSRCAHCDAPPEFLYLNDGRQASQLRCKVCGGLSQLAPRHRLTHPTRYGCPYCHSALYRWKQRPDCNPTPSGRGHRLGRSRESSSQADRGRNIRDIRGQTSSRYLFYFGDFAVTASAGQHVQLRTT